MVLAELTALRSIALGVSTAITVVLVGCSSPSGPGSGSGGGTSNTSLTGNWEFDGTATTTNVPFTVLSGYLHEAGASAAQFTTVDVLAHSSGCYLETKSIPLKGNVTGSTVQVSSFEVDGQTLNITAQKNGAGTYMSGSYSIYGGCANGAAGTIVGNKYAALSGTYSGSLAGSAGKTLSLTLDQDPNGTGEGTFLVSGTASFSGFSCFSTGTLAATGAGYVSGSYANLTFATNDPGGAQLAILGNFDTAADTIKVSSVTAIGGSCPGSLGAATLTQ